MANVKRDVDVVSGPLMEEMSIYSVKHQTKGLLEEYLRRVLLEKPKDLVAFLITEITERPYVPPPPETEVDER